MLHISNIFGHFLHLFVFGLKQLKNVYQLIYGILILTLMRFIHSVMDNILGYVLELMGHNGGRVS